VRRNLSTETVEEDLKKVAKAFASAPDGATLRIETDNGLKKTVPIGVIRSDLESLSGQGVIVDSWPVRAEGAGRKARELDLSFLG